MTGAWPLLRARRADRATVEAVRYLLTLAPVEVRPEVCALLRIERYGVVPGVTRPGGRVDPEPGRHTARTVARLPKVARWWMLREDSPELNRLILSDGWLPPGLAADVRDGLPFGPGRTGQTPDRLEVLWWSAESAGPAPTEELIARLRAAVGKGALSKARAAVRELRRDGWPLVRAADEEEPLPGFARWALAERIDCPAELRAAFGSHAKFEHRLRATGLTTSCRDLVERTGPAWTVLRLLDAGRWAFPTELAPAEDLLRPLVERDLGGRPEAWLALDRLLPTFRGTVGALLAAAGAAEPGEELPELPEAPPNPPPARSDRQTAREPAGGWWVMGPAPLSAARRERAESRGPREAEPARPTATGSRKAAPPPRRGLLDRLFGRR